MFQKSSQLEFSIVSGPSAGSAHLYLLTIHHSEETEVKKKICKLLFTFPLASYPLWGFHFPFPLSAPYCVSFWNHLLRHFKINISYMRGLQCLMDIRVTWGALKFPIARPHSWPIKLESVWGRCQVMTFFVPLKGFSSATRVENYWFEWWLHTTGTLCKTSLFQTGACIS